MRARDARPLLHRRGDHLDRDPRARRQRAHPTPVRWVLLVAAQLIIAVVVIDLASDDRWLDVSLLMLALALLTTGHALQRWARSELVYRPVRQRKRR